MGSGSGRISLLIARSGGKPTLLDISSRAIRISKTVFEKNSMTSHFCNGSILNAPFKPKTFDVVWNSGVLEHFKKDDQVKALKEMTAVCKEDGCVITFIPYSGAIFYRIAKFYDEKRNRWPYGYEKSIKSMRGLADICGLKLVREYPIAFRAQLEYFLSRFYLEKIVKLVFRIFGDLENRKFLTFLGGYLLVSICKVKPK
jgi:ubiquinone/menaquinone biosynthesis C-methylase UbiE